MPQGSFILAAMLGLFVLFIIARGELGEYVRLLV